MTGTKKMQVSGKMKLIELAHSNCGYTVIMTLRISLKHQLLFQS